MLQQLRSVDALLSDFSRCAQVALVQSQPQWKPALHCQWSAHDRDIFLRTKLAWHVYAFQLLGRQRFGTGKS